MKKYNSQFQESLQIITSPLDTQMHRQEKKIIFPRPSELTFGYDNQLWRKKGLSILIKVFKFIHIITQNYFPIDSKLLDRQIFKIIKDQSSDYNYYRYNGYLQKDNPSEFRRSIFNYFGYYLEHSVSLLKNYDNWFLFKPDDNFMIFWNIYIIIIVTINSFYVSFRLSFTEIDTSYFYGKSFLFEIIPSYSFLFEIILKFNTCTYKQGILIAKRNKIILNYLQGSFIIDSIIAIPFFVGQMINFRYFDLFVLLKVFQLSPLTNQLFNRLELTQRQTAIFDLSKFMQTIHYINNQIRFFIIIVAHFCSCIWHIIGQVGEFGDNNSQTWLKAENIENEQWLVRYIYSFYWSIVTMTTIGYGDITPVNVSERVFVIFVTFFATGVFAYSINNIGQIFRDLSKQQAQFKTNMNSLNKYLKRQNISSELQNKLRRYFEYLWSKPQEEEIIQFKDLIPEQLKQEMISDMNIQILKQIPLFSKFSQPFLKKLSLELKDKSIHTDEYLYKKGQWANNLYILISGDISIGNTINSREHILVRYQTVKQIGDLAFFHNLQYQFDAKANKSCDLLYIDKLQFQLILKQFYKDQQIYHEAIQQSLLENNMKCIHNECQICHSSTHHLAKCPCLFGLTNKAKSNYLHRKTTQCYRQKIIRDNTSRRVSSTKHKFLIMESIVQFVMRHEDYCQIEMIQHQLQTSIFQSTLCQQQRISRKFSASQRRQSANNFSLNRLPSLLSPMDPNQGKKYKYKQQQLSDGISEEIPDYNHNENNCQDFSIVLQKDKHQQPLINRSISNNNLNLKLEVDDDSDSDMICGQYHELFYDFECFCEFTDFFPHNNLSSILPKHNDTRIQRVNSRKTKKQETILSLLKQTQKMRL